TRTAAPVSRSSVMVPSRSRVAAQRSQDALFADLLPAALTTAATETLENVWRDIGDCTRCGLCEGRTQVVNTHGNPKARLMFVIGNTALRNLLEMREGISRVRGQFRDFRGIKVMPTFHPAYLLRDPSKKRETWEDLKKVRDYLDTLT